MGRTMDETAKVKRGVKTLRLITARTLQMMRPQPDLPIDRFLDEYRVLSSHTAESPGPWSTDLVPYMRGPLAAFKRRETRRIVLKWGIQLGKTEYILNLLLWIFVRKPGSSMIVFPKKETAKNEFSAKRLTPMIRDCPVLRTIFPENRRKGKMIDMKDQKTYIGGSIKLTGVDATDLSSTPVRDLFVDEVSKFEANIDNHGNAFYLAEGRQSNFFDAKAVYTSSPAEEGRCHITRFFDETRQHVYCLPCPHCGGRIELLWENMIWDFDKPETARYRCQLCLSEIDHREKRRMLAEGEWICTTPDRSEAMLGYHLSTLYSPWRSWAQLTEQYIRARNELQTGSEDGMRDFVNNRLARTYLPATEGVDDSSLFSRKEVYGAEVPAGVLYLTAGVDVNSNNICLELVGWGEGDESWSIDYRTFHGDPRQTEVWLELEEYLLRPFKHEFGFYVGVDAVAVDQGFLKHMAESFVHQHKARRFFAVKGERGWGKKIIGDPYYTEKGRGGRKVPLYPLCDAEAKVQIYSDLRRSAGPRSCHFPLRDNPEKDSYSRRFFQEMTCERIRTRSVKGYPVKEWEKPQKMRNEPLDCRKYAMAARIILEPNYGSRKVTYEKRQLEVERMISLGAPEDTAAGHWFYGRSAIGSPNGKSRRAKNAGGSSWVKGW